MPNDFEDRFGQSRNRTSGNQDAQSDPADSISNESMDDTSESRPSLRELIKRKQSQKSTTEQPAKRPSIRPTLSGYSPKDEGGVNFAALIGEARKNLVNESPNNNGIQLDLKKARAEVKRTNQEIEANEGRAREMLVEEMIRSAPPAPPAPPAAPAPHYDPMARVSSMANGTTEALFGFKGAAVPHHPSAPPAPPGRKAPPGRTEKSMIRRINELASSDLQEKSRADGRRGTSGVLRLPDSSILEEIAKGPGGPYRIRVDDLEYGPTDSSVILRLVERGLVTGADEISKSAWGGWQRLENHSLFIHYMERPFDRVLEEDSKIGVAPIGHSDAEEKYSHTANGFHFPDETRVANSSYSLARSLAARGDDGFDKENTAVEIEAGHFSQQAQNAGFAGRDQTLVQSPVLTSPMRPNKMQGRKEGFTEVSVSDIAFELAHMDGGASSAPPAAPAQPAGPPPRLTGILPPIIATPNAVPVLTPESQRTAERDRDEEEDEEKRNNTMIGHQAVASTPEEFISDAHDTPIDVPSVGPRDPTRPMSTSEAAFEIPAGAGEEKIAPDAVTPVPGKFKTGANAAVPSGFDDFVVPEATHEDVVVAASRVSGPNAAVSEVEVPNAGPPSKRSPATVATLENQPVPAYIKNDAFETVVEEEEKSRSPMLYVVIAAVVLLAAGGVFVALRPSPETPTASPTTTSPDQVVADNQADNSASPTPVVPEKDEEKQADAAGDTPAAAAANNADDQKDSGDAKPEDQPADQQGDQQAAAGDTAPEGDQKGEENQGDSAPAAEQPSDTDSAADTATDDSAKDSAQQEEKKGDNKVEEPAAIPTEFAGDPNSQRAIRIRLLSQLADNPNDATLIAEFDKSIAEQAMHPPAPTEIRASWKGFKKLDTTPVSYLTKDPDGVEWEFIPENDRGPSWRGDYAFYQLCGLIDCGFEVPEARLAFVSESTVTSLAGDQEAGKMPVKGGKIEGVLRRHLANTVPFQIEDTSIWRTWLSRRTPMATLQPKILSVDINGGSDETRADLAKIGPTILQVARGVSNILAADYLTNNFGRFARHRSEYGQNVRFQPEPPFVLIAIDNQDAFQARESTRVRGRFNWSDRIGKNFLESVRRLKPDHVSEVLFPHITGAEKAAMSVFWEQRSDIINTIDRRIQSYGADDILLP